MPNITDSQLDEMLSQMDPKVAAQLRASLAGDTAFVYCMSKKCKGRKIGALNSAGQWVNISQVNGSKLLSSRPRLDGQLGFRCRCGNSSITSPAETGIITGAAPTRSQLAELYQKQQAAPATVKQNSDGTVTVDNFKIEYVRSTN